jgi:hypothetical protein
MLQTLKSLFVKESDPLTRFTEGVYQEWLKAHPQSRELEHLRGPRDQKRFFVSRMGSTGSTWFAKLLDSSPEVHCSHELVTQFTYPQQSFNAGDQQRMIEAVAKDAVHGAYQSVGDVGSIYLTHHRLLKHFNNACLIRHPARLLNTRLSNYPNHAAYTEITETTFKGCSELWGIDVKSLKPIDQIFVHDAFIFAAHAWAIGATDFIRIEDLSEVERCQAVATHVTGVEFSLDLVAYAISHRVNQRTKSQSIQEIVESFSPEQRGWYRQMLGDIAPRFGYELEADVKR